MSDKSDKRENDTVCTHIPKALYERVLSLCKSKGLNPSEFIFDAISEKLTNIHRERRKRQRL